MARDSRQPARLGSMKNLGPISERWLVAAGIKSPFDLERLGPIEAYRRVKAEHPRKVTLVMLWALTGALMDVDYRMFPEELKTQLRQQLAERLFEGERFNPESVGQ